MILIQLKPLKVRPIGYQKEMYTVECTNDECTATINKMKETQDEVIKIWNRRANNDEQSRD